MRANTQRQIARIAAVVWIAETIDGDEGMSTAEYAIGTIAAAAFAAVLYAVVTGDSIVTALTAIVQRALSVTF
jgi:hypothetical protein